MFRKLQLKTNYSSETDNLYSDFFLPALSEAVSYRRAVGAFRYDPGLGALLVAYVVTAVTYNITEAGFRMLSQEWFFLLLSIVAASRAIIIANRTRGIHVSLNQTSWPSESSSPFGNDMPAEVSCAQPTRRGHRKVADDSYTSIA